MLLSILSAHLFENMLAGKRVLRAGKKAIRTGQVS